LNYYFNRKLCKSFEQAVQLVTEALNAEGLGVLTKINIHVALKEKLDIDFGIYKIPGACNPAYAYKA